VGDAVAYVAQAGRPRTEPMTHIDKANLNVFVSVGTHEQGFPRLLSAITRLIYSDQTGAKWRIQTGPAAAAFPEHVQTQGACTHAEMLENLDWADVMISQASPGNVFTALAMTTQPIVVARQHHLSEHVDDHQMAFARYLSETGLAMEATDALSIATCLETLRLEEANARVERLKLSHNASLLRTEVWVNRFDKAIHELT
jgi:UDP-N-acetylglucosamine transferase subunit ALG13